MIDPNKPELRRAYRELKFFVGLGYLNLSYVPQTALVQKQHCQDVLFPSQPSPVSTFSNLTRDAG